MPINKIHNLLLVDDHQMVAAGLSQWLAEHYRVTIAYDLAQMQESLIAQEFDLALLDLQMNDGNPNKRYREALNAVGLPILIVAATISDAELFQCYTDDVRGYVPKNLSKEALSKVVAKVLQDGRHWDEEMQQRLQEFSKNKPKIPNRLLPVLRHLLAGKSLENQAIAEAENLSIRTVGNYISTLLNVYRVSDRHQLINKLTNMGYTQDILPD